MIPKQQHTWQLIHESLQQNIAVMLMYVLESKGSSPGRQGFMMAVNACGQMKGSLGGGIMEHKFIELAKSKMLQEAEEISVHQQVHDKAAPKNQSGMICSGEQTIFLYTVKKEATATVENIIVSLQNNENATLQLSPEGISFSRDIPPSNFDLQIKGDNDFLLVEKTGYKNQLYIIGAGHCSLALSAIMNRMDFYIHLMDDRHGLNTMEQNDFVHRKILMNGYDELPALIPEGDSSFVVIMTFGYRTDAMVLKALQGKRFAYIGMMGSKNKTDKMFEQLKQEGINAAWLDTIYAPIGLPIKSQATEEIAISVAAEIIKVKNKEL